MIYSQILLTNVVSGTQDRFITILEYPLHDLKKIVKEVTELQSVYRLSDAFFFTDGQKVYVAILKAIQKTQLDKILKKSTSLNKTHMKKYGRLRMPISGRKYSDGKYSPSNINYLKKITWYDKEAWSKGHSLLLKKIFEIPLRNKEFVGEGKTCFVHNVVKTW